ncbi:MAG: hypothetical protein K6E36_08540 [Oscillospiraceae bacterium]|nr:hypothetical protein [Oscillospiraceae bacterium]MCR5306529.1 hypothetical protein [Oscillospiraceae bacterium]
MNDLLSRIHMGPAPCAADLTDGSERGEYVAQDYILDRLGRPMRSVNLMYCYYPLDEAFPARARDAFADRKIGFQWDYPYDDYFPYTGGLHGTRDGAVFRQMADIRAHGQDVTLTLTLDPNLTDDHLAAIGADLRPYGRVMLRLNHEATGNWFAFTKRASYQQIADFFVRAGNIIREHAPNVQTVICIGGIEDPSSEEIVMEREFAQTVTAADIWSVDKYLALHWGWPYDTAVPGGKSHKRDSVDAVYDMTKRSFRRFTELNGGQKKPMIMSEFNADGDVTGPYDQCVMTDRFFRLLKNDPEHWLTGINFYQFRDRGRLGLETEHPNNPAVGIAQPVLRTFRDWIADPLFYPVMTECGSAALPAMLRWGGSEDAEGLALTLHFEGNPHFCELQFDGDRNNYMLELNGKWFHKAPGTQFVDLMPAFYEKPLRSACDLTLRLFAPPADGKNDLSRPDGLMNSYTTVTELPRIRIAYAPVEADRD